jgi:hypothetical protein
MPITKEQALEAAKHLDEELYPYTRATLIEFIEQPPALPEPTDEQTQGEWRTVERDGYPHYEPGTTYIGINSTGFACCFTRADVSEGDDACVMNTGEEDILMMTNLRWWRVLDRPNVLALNSGGK